MKLANFGFKVYKLNPGLKMPVKREKKLSRQCENLSMLKLNNSCDSFTKFDFLAISHGLKNLVHIKFFNRNFTNSKSQPLLHGLGLCKKFISFQFDLNDVQKHP